MPEENSSRSAPLKLLAFSGVGFVLSIGLCGGAAVIPKAEFLIGLGVLLLFGSIIAFIVAIVWLVVAR